MRRGEGMFLLAASAIAFAGGACADVWGFRDLSYGPDQSAGGSGGSSASGPSVVSSSGTGSSGTVDPCGNCSPGQVCTLSGCSDQCPSDMDLLTDPNNCGACQMVCAGTCVAAACNAVVLASSLADPAALVLDDTYVYWIDFFGSIMRVAKTGGSPTTLYLGHTNAGPIAIDANNLYWADGGIIQQMPKGGGARTQLVQTVDFVFALTVGKAVDWVTSDSVWSVPIGGGTPVPLATGQNQPTAIVADQTNLYWVNQGTTGNPDGSVQQMPESGGTILTLAPGEGASGIAVDASSVYWTTGSALRRVSIGGGSIATLAMHAGRALALDDANVYVAYSGTAAPNGDITRTPKNGGALATIVAGQVNSIAVAVDQTHIYWIDAGGYAGVTGTLLEAPQ